ncbi:MAG: hypothetical protein ACJA05_000895 [Porticoccus sp.]|uniref:polysialyltransferase family glycosyltransferase n=1 Tax=Porticoccus sp. TaxID=2024853 RepID=UPI0039E6AFC2
MNIFIVGSPWHAIVAKALIKKEVVEKPLFIVEEISDSSYAQIMNVLKASNVHAVFSHDRTRFSTIKKKGLFGFLTSMRDEFAGVSRSARSVRGALYATDKVANVYYFNFYSPLTRAFLNELRGSSLVNMYRVEDGVCDYFPFNFMHHGSLEKRAKNILALVCGKSHLYRRSCSWLFEETAKYYLFFPEKVDPQWSAKELFSLLEAKDEIKLICASSENDDALCILNPGTSALMIGQTLYEDGICSLEDEISVYLDASRFLGKVYFKPHPRSCREKIDRLTASGLSIVSTQLTAEALICKWRFGCVVGMWSNTIIYSRGVFELESYSMLYDLLDKSGGSADPHIAGIHHILIEKFRNCYVDFRESKGR